MITTRLEFTNENGEKLNGFLDAPISKPRAYAIFAHCFTCSASLPIVRRISEALNKAGIAVLRFDFTGLGNSEGDFSQTNFSANIADLHSAYQYLAQNYQAPELIIGHSFGGSAVIRAARNMPSAKAVVSIGAPAVPEHISQFYDHKKEEILEKGEANIEVGGRTFTIRKQFLEDLKENDHGSISSLGLPLLVMHSPQDEIVSIENAKQIYAAAKHPKSYISLDGADHLLSRKEDACYAGNVIAAWAERYISPQPALETDKTIVRNDAKHGLTCEVETGGYRMIADEPKDIGGNELGPTPYDLLKSALGVCTAMTLRLYAERKQWDLQHVCVTVTHEKDEKKVDHFSRHIILRGELDKEQEDKLIEIANKCPVHRTLENNAHIHTLHWKTKSSEE